LEFLLEYGLFFAKTLTIIIGIVVIIVTAAALGSSKQKEEGELQIVDLGERLEDYRQILEDTVLNEAELKTKAKAEKQKAKEKAKAEKVAQKKKSDDKTNDTPQRRVFVLDFDGDIRASATEALRTEITALLTLADPKAGDEVLLRLESSGGMVHSYGLAASQLQRIRAHELPLTIVVDKVAASGGYMMACVGSRILAAPFAIIGSIGVVAQLPNFNRLLKKHDVDFEQYTAGEYKRTVTMFGENTDKARDKFQLELDDTHILFKDFIHEHRPDLDLESVATGEHWYGSRALELNLVDALQTSDDYLLQASKEAKIYAISYEAKRSWMEKMGISMNANIERGIWHWLSKERDSRFTQ
jgi:serine protease SohB